MKALLSRLTSFAFVVACVVGCGGSSPVQDVAGAGKGTVSLSIDWPNSGARLLPNATTYIQASITKGTTTLLDDATKDSSTQKTTITFDSGTPGVPHLFDPGTYTIEARAYSATGTLPSGGGLSSGYLARGTATIKIVAGENTDFKIIAASAATNLKVVDHAGLDSTLSTSLFPGVAKQITRTFAAGDFTLDVALQSQQAGDPTATLAVDDGAGNHELQVNGTNTTILKVGTLTYGADNATVTVPIHPVKQGSATLLVTYVDGSATQKTFVLTLNFT